MIEKKDITPIGKFQKTHALKGELNAILDIDPEYFLTGNPLIVEIDGIFVPFYAETIRNKGTYSYLIKLQGIDQEETAREFVNKEILMLTKDADDWLDAEEEDIDGFIGYSVINKLTDENIGKIEFINQETENILFGIKDSNSDIFYIPAVEDFISEIDYEGKRIKMDLPEGLLEINND